jgi:glycosyltransferase involved in cell wall biosynthesis
VGQLIPRKNIDNLIRAFANISHYSDTLKIIGGGDKYDELSTLVRDLKCENRVSFIGQLNSEQIVSYYAKSDTLVLPSTREVWGLVVNEALASGLHVVVSENCGVSELVGKMKGVYVCAGTAESIEEAMVRSRQEFTSRIVNPEISNFSTNHFAREFSENLFQNVD